MKMIEFIALPGAGKSTVRKLLVKQLKEKNKKKWLTFEEAFYIVARKNIDIHLRMILKITPTPIATRFVGKIVNRSQWQQEAQSFFLAEYGKALSFLLSSKAFQCSSLVDRQRGILALLFLGSVYKCIQEYEFSGNNIIYDEGFIQKSLSFIPTHVVADYETDSESIYGYLKNIPKPDILIFIKTSIENSLQRMHSRPEGLTERLRLQDDNRILSFLSRSMVHVEKTILNLKDENEIQIITIDNNSSPEAAVESILLALEKI